jgi:hypothetical protein
MPTTPTTRLPTSADIRETQKRATKILAFLLDVHLEPVTWTITRTGGGIKGLISSKTGTLAHRREQLEEWASWFDAPVEVERPRSRDEAYTITTVYLGVPVKIWTPAKEQA